MAKVWRFVRLGIAAVLAPLTVSALVMVGRSGYLQDPGHQQKYWVEGGWLVDVILPYLIAAPATYVVLLAVFVVEVRLSVLRVLGLFVLVCAAVAAALSRTWELGLVAAIAGTIMALAFGFIAGLPWRAPRVV